MSGNRSLDEFLSGDDGEQSEGNGADDGNRETSGEADGGCTDVSAEADDETTGAGDGTRDDPAVVSTYGWSPDGAACPACGAVVEERWGDGGELVCADCKDW